MTKQQLKDTHNSWAKWITLANAILIAGILVGESKRQQRVDDSIINVQEKIEQHIMDTNVHMPMSEKIKIFVPRQEIEAELQSIKKQLDRIENKID